MGNGEDRRSCETVLRSLGVSQERLDRIRQRISDFREEWDTVRRPSRPAGPGRPRGHKRANASDPMEAVDPLPETSGPPSSSGQAGGMVMGSAGGVGAMARKVQKKAPCKAKAAGTAFKGAGGAGHSGAGGGVGTVAIGCPASGLHNGGWQPPPGAESPEDYVLPPTQSDSASGPVAAIVIEDDKSGLWQSYQDRDESPVCVYECVCVCVCVYVCVCVCMRLGLGVHVCIYRAVVARRVKHVRAAALNDY
jgi:hypothetical protein